MLILFKSKCTSVDYSCCWGLFKYSCARAVTGDSDEEEGGANARGEDAVQPQLIYCSFNELC